MAGAYSGPLERVNDHCWRIPKSYKPGMRVDGLIYADEAMIKLIRSDSAPEQVANVAFLPGIQLASLAMPDIHWGYGFCIGGVCATDPDEGGVISPGGVGYDINCGVRLMRTNLTIDEVKPKLPSLVEELFRQIPAGVGGEGRYHYTPQELRQLMAEGPAWLIPRGCATQSDIDHTEAHGRLEGGSPRPGQRPGTRARPLAMRNAGRWQSFSRSAGRRRSIRCSRCRGDGPSARSGVRDDPFRLPRIGISGMRRRAARLTRSAREIRHRAPRPAACLRADR